MCFIIDLKQKNTGCNDVSINLPYFFTSTAIGGQITPVFVAILTENQITPVALWAKMLFMHITMTPNKIKQHS